MHLVCKTTIYFSGQHYYMLRLYMYEYVYNIYGSTEGPSFQSDITFRPMQIQTYFTQFTLGGM